MTSATARDGHVGQVLKMVGLLAVIGAAIGFAAYSLLGDDPAHQIADEAAMINVECTACDETFDMPFSVYNQQAPRGTEVDGPIDCPRCGAAHSVYRAGTAPAEPSPGSRDEPAPQEDEPPPDYNQRPEFGVS